MFELSMAKKIVKDRRTGAPKYVPQVRDQGRANVDWLKKHGLTKFSTPLDWKNALLPEKCKVSDPKLW